MDAEGGFSIRDARGDSADVAGQWDAE